MPDSHVLELTDDNVAETLASPVPVLIDFTATWCAPCRAIAPHVAALARAYAGRLRVAKCDVDDNVAIAARYGIRGVPTLLIFSGGQVVGQLTGSAPRARLEALVERTLEVTRPRPEPATP